MLEHPADPAAGYGCRRHRGKGLVVEPDAALLGRVIPEMQFNRVLLPAPFGPIKPTIDPDSSAKVTSLKA